MWPITTSRYDRRDKQARHKAAVLHVPYTRRTLEADDD